MHSAYCLIFIIAHLGFSTTAAMSPSDHAVLAVTSTSQRLVCLINFPHADFLHWGTEEEQADWMRVTAMGSDVLRMAMEKFWN